MIICGYCHAVYISLLPFSHLHHVIIHALHFDPLICHEDSEGSCHLLKCMHWALCCPNAVFDNSEPSSRVFLFDNILLRVVPTTAVCFFEGDDTFRNH